MRERHQRSLAGVIEAASKGHTAAQEDPSCPCGCEDLLAELHALHALAGRCRQPWRRDRLNNGQEETARRWDDLVRLCDTKRKADGKR